MKYRSPQPNQVCAVATSTRTDAFLLLIKCQSSPRIVLGALHQHEMALIASHIVLFIIHDLTAAQLLWPAGAALTRSPSVVLQLPMSRGAGDGGSGSLGAGGGGHNHGHNKYDSWRRL